MIMRWWSHRLFLPSFHSFLLFFVSCLLIIVIMILMIMLMREDDGKRTAKEGLFSWSPSRHTSNAASNQRRKNKNAMSLVMIRRKVRRKERRRVSLREEKKNDNKNYHENERPVLSSEVSLAEMVLTRDTLDQLHVLWKSCCHSCSCCHDDEKSRKMEEETSIMTKGEIT